MGEAFAARSGGKLPVGSQAATYSQVRAYLKAVEAAGTDDADAVLERMRSMPINDAFRREWSYSRRWADGSRHVRRRSEIARAVEGERRLHHDSQRIPGDQAFQTAAQSECPYLQEVRRRESTSSNPKANHVGIPRNLSARRHPPLSRARTRPDATAILDGGASHVAGASSISIRTASRMRCVRPGSQTEDCFGFLGKNTRFFAIALFGVVEGGHDVHAAELAARRRRTRGNSRATANAS